MLNRTLQPAFSEIKNIEYIKPKKFLLENAIPVYSIKAGKQDVIKIDFIFHAGTWFQPQPLVASFTNRMLLEGTTNRTSQQISEELDFYGAYLNLDVGADYCYIELYTLKKFLSKTLPIVEDIIKNSIFPQQELSTLIEKRKQRFFIENEKVKVLARKTFLKTIFGYQHPYGKEITATDFDTITPQILSNYYTNFYSSQNCAIIVSGKVNNDTIQTIKEHFGGNDWIKNYSQQIIETHISPSSNKEVMVKKAEALQCAIRIGKPMINKLHPDYKLLLIVNTILGGYFGSRLMKNIREEKGYTYGIGSAVVSLKNAGYFVVATEVASDVCSNAVNEIFYEIKKLRTELVNQNELTLVKNYILGELMRNFDGPFANAENFRGLLEYDLKYSYFDEIIHTIKTITPDQILQIANEYLNEDSMYLVIAGKNK